MSAPVFHYEAIIKVRTTDPPERRRRDIEEGIGYAVAILMDEYGVSATEIEDLLEREIDNAQDHEGAL
jgi:hypothetical protein